MKLGNLCEVVRGSSPRPKNDLRFYGGNVPRLMVADVTRDGKSVTPKIDSLTERGALQSRPMKKGDVVIAVSGNPGLPSILQVDACIHDGFVGLRELDSSRISIDYLYWFLLHVKNKINEGAVGAIFKNLTTDQIKNIEIPLPPLDEQKRMAVILDKADALREKRRQAIAKLGTLLQSVFLDMFGDPVTNPKGWELKTVSSVVDCFQGGKSILSESSESAAHKFRVLKVSAVTELVFKPEESKPVPLDYLPPQDHLVQVGDLLFSRANTTELVGAVAYVWDTPNDLLLPDKLWRFVWKLPQRVVPLFIWAMFHYPSFRYELGKRATGTSGSMKNISQEKVLSMFIPIPDLRSQRQFASFITHLHQTHNNLKNSLIKIENLFFSLQQRAFNGELFNNQIDELKASAEVSANV
jgi:type I restriction enzyme, S subunit